MPLVVIIVLDRALRADAGVVHNDVDAAEVLRDRGHALADGAVIGDVHTVSVDETVGHLAVEDRDLRTLCAQALDDGRADPARAAGDDRLQPVERSASAHANTCFWDPRPSMSSSTTSPAFR